MEKSGQVSGVWMEQESNGRGVELGSWTGWLCPGGLGV